MAVIFTHLSLLFGSELVTCIFDSLLELVGHGWVTNALKELDTLLPVQVLKLSVVHQESELVLSKMSKLVLFPGNIRVGCISRFS